MLQGLQETGAAAGRGGDHWTNFEGRSSHRFNVASNVQANVLYGVDDLGCEQVKDRALLQNPR